MNWFVSKSFKYVISILLLAVMFLGFFDLFAYTGIGSQLSNKPSPANTPKSSIFVFGDWNRRNWLDTSEALALRGKVNVTNLAACVNSVCHYNRLYGVSMLPGHWIVQNANADVAYVTPESEDTTSFSFRDISGNSYVLNLFQPFIVKSQPSKIFMFDYGGEQRYQAFDAKALIPLTEVQKTLPQQLQPNPNLST